MIREIFHWKSVELQREFSADGNLYPPSKNYLPPKLTDSYEKPSKVAHPEMEYLAPPNKGYLPPTLSDGYIKPHPEVHQEYNSIDGETVDIKSFSKEFLSSGKFRIAPVIYC